MTIEQGRIASELAGILKHHQKEIAASWAEKIRHMPDSRYRELTMETLQVSTMRGLGAMVEALSTGCYRSLETYVVDVSLTRLREGFNSGEVTEALLLCKDAALPVIGRAPRLDAVTAWAMISELDTCLRWMARQCSALYTVETNRHLREQHARTALMLEVARRATSSLEMDDVLLHVARSLTTAAGVDHCSFFLIDEEQGLLIPRLGIDNRPVPATMVQTFLERPVDPGIDCLLREVLERKEPLACYDVQTDPRVSREMVESLGVKSVLAVPLMANDRVLAVAMVCTFYEYHTFSADQIELAWGLADSAALAIENARLYGESRERLAESQSLQRVMSALLEELDLGDVMEIVCTEARDLTGALGSAVFLLENGTHLRVAFNVGPDPGFDRLPLEGSLTGIAVRTGQPVLSNDTSSDERMYTGLPMPPSLLAIPLSVRGRTIGTLGVIGKPGGFSKDDVRIASLLANQAAIAIDNARLYQQVEQLAVVQERARLSREIHDDLAQTLGALQLKASLIDGQLAAGEIARARTHLTELQDAISGVYAAVREEIFDLRALVSPERGFLPALREYLADYQAHHGVEVCLEAGSEEIALAGTVQVQVVRIIQEALTNVRRHAGTNRVRVRLKRESGQLCIRIEDDGQGFDTTRVADREQCYFGLQVMRERAESVGGALVLESRPGHGTKVVLHVPLKADAE